MGVCTSRTFMRARCNAPALLLHELDVDASLTLVSHRPFRTPAPLQIAPMMVVRADRQ